MKKITSYKDKFIQMDKEAKATFVLAIVITLFFWLSIFLLQNLTTTLFLMPLWFVVSCIGGYLLSVIGVIILIKFFMKNFSLDDEDEDCSTDNEQ